VICSYKVTAKLSNVLTSEAQVNLVFNGDFSHPNYRVFQQYRPDVAVVGWDLNGYYRESSRSKTIDHRQEPIQSHRSF